MKKYLNLFDFSQEVNYKTEVLSGITVALALVPEAIAFALIAGLSPLTGLYAAIVAGVGLIESLLTPNKITERYLKVGKKVQLKHLSRDCKRLLKNADDIIVIEVNVLEDPTYKVAVDTI